MKVVGDNLAKTALSEADVDNQLQKLLDTFLDILETTEPPN